MSKQTAYERFGGEEGVRRLANAVYDAMDVLPEAEHIRAMHSANLDTIKEKLYEYLTGWLGGPQLYSDKYGTVCLTDPHKPYAIGPDERDQWLLCMDIALEKTGVSDELKELLKVPMFRLADVIRNRDTSEPIKQDPNAIPLTNL